MNEWLKTMDDVGIERTIVMASGAGARFDTAMELFGRHPERFEVWTGLDLSGADQPGFPAKAVAELERAVEAGARGVGELSDKGGGLRGSGSLSTHALHVRFDPSRTASDDRELIAVGREREAFATFSARVDLHDVDVEFLCEQGHDVARTIPHVANTLGANLVVMGTRGRTRAASLLIGSETEHALLWSDAPVLAVKHFGARLRFLEALADARLRQRDNPQFT